MLKLKNEKRSKCSLALLCALVLTTSCAKKEEVSAVEINSEPIEYESENRTNYQDAFKEISISSDIIDEITDSSNTEEKVYCHIDNNYISISKTTYGDYPTFSNEEYQKINKLLENENIYTLIIDNIGDEVDFTRLNLDNINCLFLQNVKPNFNYGTLSNKSYRSLHISSSLLSDESTVNLVNFINSITLESNAAVYLYFSDSETQLHEQKIIDAVSNFKSIDWLVVDTNYFGSLNLSNLMPNRLSISTNMTKESTDLDISLNESISEFSMHYWFPELDITPIIKSIKVNSTNNNLLIQIDICSWDNKVEGIIDPNVDIKVPTSASINIQGINTRIQDVEALKHFQDFQNVCITDSEQDSKTAFIYKKDDGSFIEAVLFFDNARPKRKKRLLLN